MSSDRVIDLRRKRPHKSGASMRPNLWSAPSQGPRHNVPLRARRRRRRALIAFLVLLAIAGAVYGVSYASYLPRFTIQRINVTGTVDTSPQVITDYASTILNDGSHRLIARDNIFIYPRAVIERDIEQEFPRIRSVSVSRPSLLSNELVITVQERQEYSLWCDQACYSMDDTGYIFAQTDSSSTGEYIFSGGLANENQPIGQTFAPTHLSGLFALLVQLSQSGFRAEGASVENDQDFSISLSPLNDPSGVFALKASYGEDPEGLVSDLKLVLSSDPLQGHESDLEYVDLRFGDKVYFKLKGSAEATTQ